MTIQYMETKIRSLIHLTDNELNKINIEYTQYTAQFIKRFISEFGKL